MNIKDTFKATGKLTLEIFKHGILYDTIHLNNAILNSGKSLILNALVGVSDKTVGRAGIGDSNIANDLSFLDLQGISTFKNTIDGFSFPGAGQVQIDFSFSSSEGNGINVKEFALFSTDGTTIFNRVVWTGTTFIKTSDFTLRGNFLITVS